jgi:hypothetical protein
LTAAAGPRGHRALHQTGHRGILILIILAAGSEHGAGRQHLVNGFAFIGLEFESGENVLMQSVHDQAQFGAGHGLLPKGMNGIGTGRTLWR